MKHKSRTMNVKRAASDTLVFTCPSCKRSVTAFTLSKTIEDDRGYKCDGEEIKFYRFNEATC